MGDSLIRGVSGFAVTFQRCAATIFSNMMAAVYLAREKADNVVGKLQRNSYFAAKTSKHRQVNAEIENK
jgi:hypothetical protein